MKLRLFHKKDGVLIKILLLGLGLAMGLVLIAKVYYERVYDNYMESPENIYVVFCDFSIGDGDGDKSFGQTPGAIAPGIKAYSPAVAAATRVTGVAENLDFSLVDQNGQLSRDKYKSRSVMVADTSFFEIFTRRLSGNTPKEGLNIKSHIYISESYANQLNASNPNSLIGGVIAPTYVGDGSLKFVIDGIYENFPENSTFKEVDILLSMPSLGLVAWDGSNNWVGNDRYQSYVKLVSGTSMEDVDKSIAQMCEKQLPQEELKKSGVTINYHLEPLTTNHIKKGSDAATICTIMLILAAVVLIASILNYVLLAISAMVHKTKMIAVRKCYGASTTNIYGMVFSDVLLHLFISLSLACLLLYAFRGLVQEIIGASLGGLISSGSVAVLVSVCLIVFVFCGLLPGIVYSKVPVAAAFRQYKERSRKWNLVLLFMQFAMSSLFVTLIAIVVMQYNYMINSNLGYSYQNIALVNLSEQYGTKKDFIKDEISRLGCVEQTTSCSELPINWPSGNNVLLPGDEREYFNIADMYFASNGYFLLLDIPIVDGRNFTEDPGVTNEIMVSRSFVKKMKEMAGWEDGAVGKSVLISEHSQSANDIFTICGVYEDYLIGTYSGHDKRPSVQFYGGNLMECESEYRQTNWLLIKLKEVTPQNIAAIQKIVNDVNPDGGANVTLYSNEVLKLYKDSQNVKNSVMIAGMIVLLITLIGLLGYTQDEINRRRSEIAIRKINGATVAELLQMFLNGVLKIVLPAVIIGSVIAYFVATMMLDLYSKKIALSWWIFVGCALVVVLLVSAVVVMKTYRTANANPIKNLKTD